MDSGVPIRRRGFLSAAAGTAAAVGYGGTAAGDVDPELNARSGRLDAIVRLAAGPDDDAKQLSADRVVTELRSHAATTQQGIVDQLERTAGTEVRRQFWLANAILVTVDTDRASFAEIAALDGVDRVHRADADTGRRRPELAETEQAATQSGSDGAVSYGLEMMNVPDVWERFGTRGDGAAVAVIDTGVDASHPDIDVAAWAEFDAEGQRVESEPYDPAGHGTGMSSLATGGAASGTQIGVAPEADLLVAKPDVESGIFASSLAALEWAVENGADAASMSFDFGPLKHEAIEAVVNARAAGTVVVSAGYGPESFLSPGSMYSVLSAGAIDRERVPYRDGNGGEIRTDRYWRSDTVPDDWPDRYVVPDVVTAGVDVLAAAPDNDRFDGGHVREDGYSNGPPHISGVVALLRSLDAELSPAEIKRLIRDTAEQPGEPFEHPESNGDFGHGIANAAAAAAEVAGRDREISGTVTDTEGEPVAGATVAAVTGDTDQTDSRGRYTLSVPDGTATLTAAAAGYEPVTRTAPPGESRGIGFRSERRPDIRRAERLPTHVAPGSSLTMAFDVEHAEYATLFVRDSPRLADAESVSASINSAPVTVGEPTNIAGESTLSLELDIEAGARGVIPLDISVTDGERNAKITLDTVHVHERPMRVGEDADIERAIDVAAPETTIELAGERWELAVEGFESPFPEARFGNPIFDGTREDQAGLVVGKPLTLVAADGHDPTLVAAGGSAARTFAVQIAHHFVTLRDVEVVADGHTAAVNVLGSDGVRLRNLALSGATNGVYAQATKSLVVADSTVAAGETGVVLRDISVNALVSGNTVRDADRGVFLSGRVGERLFDVDATVAGNTFENVGTELDTEGTATVTDGSGQTRTGGGAQGESMLDLLLYAATATAVGALFYPYGRRRLGGRR